MQVAIRIAHKSDLIQKKFKADQAVRSYYKLAPYHKEFKPI